jgi:hypothetical protein
MLRSLHSLVLRIKDVINRRMTRRKEKVRKRNKRKSGWKM